jgi:hypothetical protein
MTPVIFDVADEWNCVLQSIDGKNNLQTILSDEIEIINSAGPSRGKIDQNKDFWTGGFRHELNSQWSWCTRDSPEPIEASIISSMEMSAKDDAKNQTKDENCLSVRFTHSEAPQARNCTASEIYLSCESVEKYPSNLLVRFSSLDVTLYKKHSNHSQTQGAEPIAAPKRAKKTLV